MNQKRKLFLQVFFILTLALLATLLLQAAKVRGDTLVVDQNGNGDHETIQAALNVSSKGDHIQVWDGIYHENIVINTSLTLTGNGSTTTIINGGGEGDVVTVDASGTTLEGFSVTESGVGFNYAAVRVNSGGNRFREMNLSDSGNGLLLEGPGNNSVSNCNFWNNSRGVSVYCNNNNIFDCGLKNNIYGFYLYAAFDQPELTGNSLENILVTRGSYGVYAYRVNNTALENTSVVGNSFYGIYLISSPYISVENSTIAQSNCGIYLASSNNCTLVNNTISDNREGIVSIGNSENSSVRNSRIYHNIDTGIHAMSAVDARNNWWGTNFGPYHPEDGWNGKGDAVSDHVLFDPWVGKEFTVKYVDDDAAEDGDGTIEHPLTSIQKAVDEVAKGGIVFVLEGRYTEAVEIHKALYFIGNGSNSTILDGEGSRVPLEICGDGVILRDIQCSNSGGAANQAGLVVSSHNNHISNINCSGNGGPGILFIKAHDNTLQDSSFRQNAGSGILLRQSSENLIISCDSSQNSRSGVLVEDSERNSFDRLEALDNKEDGLVFQGSQDNAIMSSLFSGNNNGLLFGSGSRENHLMNSSVSSNLHSGVLVEGAHGNTVTSSFITGNQYGVRLAAFASENTVDFNYIYSNSQAGMDASDNNGTTVQAHSNWWGSDSGPYHSEGNPTATGDNASHGVLFDPWLGKAGNKALFVNDDAPSGGNGSLQAPLNNIQDAVDATDEGGTVRIMEGHYRFEASGIHVNTQMSIIGSGWEYTLLNGQRKLDHQHIIHLDASGCLVKGLNLSWSSPHHEFGGVGIYSSDNVVTENYFGYNNHGIFMSRADNNQISNNEFYGNTPHISDYDGGSDNNIYLNNVFYGRDEPGYTPQLITVKGDLNIFTGNQICDKASLFVQGEGNVVCDNVFRGNDVYGGRAFRGLHYSGNNGRISNNSFTGYNVSMNVYDSENNTLVYNTITGNLLGIYIRGSSPDNVIQGNTFWNNSIFAINATELDDGITVDARYNRWNGSFNGPYHPQSNPEGLGDNVSDAVEFSPWYQLEQPVARIQGPEEAVLLVGGTQYFNSISLYYRPLVRYVWISSVDGLLHDGKDEQISVALRPGPHVILLRVQGEDGIWSREAAWFLNVTTKPVAAIDPEYPGSEPAVEGEPTLFMSQSVDDGEIIQYVWSSDLDGLLYNGTKGDLWFDNLSVGKHRITLRVQDNFGFWSQEATCSFRVTDRPVAIIGSTVPVTVLVNEEVRLWGHASGVDPVNYYQWHSSLDGELYSGAANYVITSSLSKGIHILSFQVQNELGVWSELVFTTLKVHERPIAGIYSILPNPAPLDTDIVFRGVGIDDGEVLRYVWRSSIWGSLYVGEEDVFTVQLLAGEHVIYLKVQDDMGIWSEEAWFRLVVAERPLPLSWAITSESKTTPGASILEEKVNFVALTAGGNGIQAFRWNSSLDKELYNGRVAGFSTSALSPGEHRITLEIQDATGLWSEPAVLDWIVHHSPVSTITAISPSPALVTEEIHFQGAGTDDGEIMIFAWDSSLDGELYSGPDSSFTIMGLQPGEHTIYLKVQDDFGIWSHWAIHTLVVEEEIVDNQAPTVSILSPEPEERLSGEFLFVGEGTDPDGSLVRYVWHSSVDGELYNGSKASFQHEGLSPGNHNITLMVKDDRGAWSKRERISVVVEDEEEGSFSGLCFLGGLLALCLTGLLVFPTPLQDYLKARLEEKGILDRLPFK